MRWTRLEICNHITQLWGKLYNEESEEDKAALLLGLDYILEDLSTTGKIPMLKKHGFINCVGEYATGTITIATANGVSTVTGDGTVWTADMVGRKLIVSGESIAYTIKSFTSGTVITLEEIYINKSDDTNTLSTASAYTIVKDTYKLANDYASLADEEIYNLKSGLDMTIRDGLEFDKEQPSRVNTGNPIDIVLRGLSENTYYSDGTIAVTHGSASITGTSTAWTTQMNGMPIRVVGDSAEYIFTYLSATTGSLDRVYEGTTATAATYKMEFPGLQLVELDPKPDTVQLIKYFYYRMLPKLANATDVCPLPIQNALLAGGIWRYSIVKEKTKLIEDNVFYQNYIIAKETLRKAGKINYHNKGMQPRTY